MNHLLQRCLMAAALLCPLEIDGSAAEVFNAGRGGHSSADLLRSIEADVLVREPSLVIIMVGTNDALNSRKLVPTDQYRQNLETLVDRVHGAGATVVLVTPPPCLTSMLYTRHERAAYGNLPPEARLTAIVDVVCSLGEQRQIPVVDYYRQLTIRKLVSEDAGSVIRNPANSNSTDGVHPNASGYALLAHLIHDTIRCYRLDTTRVVCFGDSITFGSGARGAGSTEGESWPARLKWLIEHTTNTPLVLTGGGTVDSPEVFDGQDTVIDLGIDISRHDWKQDGDLWTSQPGLLAEHKREPAMAGQIAGLFIGEIPISIPRDVTAEKLHPDRRSRCYFPPDRLQPGQMGYAEDGSLYFRWPTGVMPGRSAARGRIRPIILPPKPGMSAVSIAGSHITVKNVTAMYSGNDGFNIHGDRLGIRLEHVRALCNADEGISAHETVEMKVTHAEVAWNGSVSGGIADVNDCVTSYQHCVIHDNFGAAFFLDGRSHQVHDTLIFNQEKDFVVTPATEVVRERIDWQKP